MDDKNCLDCTHLTIEYYDEETLCLEAYCPNEGNDMKQDLEICEIFNEGNNE